MTAEAPSAAPAPRPQCPRCTTVLPAVSQGTQVIRCTGCGAALQVSVRPVEPAVPPSAESPGGARPRRRPMVEVPGPRRAEAGPAPALVPAHTITVELSQRDIEYEPEPGASPPPSARPPTPPAPPPVAPGTDVPWFAEDIERLPEVNVDLGRLALENFEPHPPLSLRPDVPPSSRTAAAPSHAPGVPASPSQVK
jgi:hypothetical protein